MKKFECFWKWVSGLSMVRSFSAPAPTLLVLLLLAVPGFGQTNDVTIDGDVTVTGDWDDELWGEDGGGAESGGQSDATQICGASNFNSTTPADTIYFRWDYELTSLPGANTADACALLDFNQNGFIDASFCASVGSVSSVLQINSVAFFDCNADGSPNRCSGGATEFTTGFSATCTIDTGVTSTLASFSTPPDTSLECVIPLSDFTIFDPDPVIGNVIFIDVCTYNSAEPNSNPVECILDGNRLSINFSTGVNSLVGPTAIELLH